MGVVCDWVGSFGHASEEPQMPASCRWSYVRESRPTLTHILPLRRRSAPPAHRPPESFTYLLPFSCPTCPPAKTTMGSTSRAAAGGGTTQRGVSSGAALHASEPAFYLASPECQHCWRPLGAQNDLQKSCETSYMISKFQVIYFYIFGVFSQFHKFLSV